MSDIKITSLMITGYNRLALSDTKSITINPNNIHLILGTNGSGKSSIMELLTPLPPSTNDFEEGGISEIHFFYGKDFFVRRSSDNKHSLYKNNEIIIENCGINKMIELCEEYFNITPAIHRLMLNKTTMTNMSLQARKEFITSISGIDFDYVNNLYDSVKRRLRDNSGAIKHLNSKILSMKEYILSDAEVDRMMKEKNELKKLLVELHESKKQEINHIPVDKIDILKIDRRMNSLDEYIKEYNSMYGIELNRDSLEANQNKLAVIIEDREGRLKQLSDKILESSNTISDKEYKDRVNTLRKQIDTISKDMILTVSDYDRLDWYNKMIDDILERSLRLSEFKMADIPDRHNKLIDEQSKLKDSINKITIDISDLSKRIDMYQSAVGNIKCPDCGFSFHSDGVHNIIESIRDEIDEKSKLLDKENNRLKELNPILEDTDKLLSDLNELKYKLKISGLYRSDDDIETLQISSIYNYMLKVSKDLSNLPELYRLNSELDSLSLYNVTGKPEVMDMLNREYDELTSVLKDLKEQYNKISKMNSDNITLVKEVEELKSYIKAKHINRKSDIVKVKNKVINNLILEINNKLTTLDTFLDKFNYMNKSTIEHTKEIESLSADIEILELLLKELSPSTGLIAESLKSFLLGYIKEVNAIISKVWSYEMEVLPYDVKELEKGMSYRFPVQIKDNKPAKDINETSESMREIINLAFRLVSLRHMGLLDFPILIDEFGRSMDEVHLIKSYDLLENIAEEYGVQMFIIAHIKSCYNRFRSFGMTIVSDLNLENLE